MKNIITKTLKTVPFLVVALLVGISLTFAGSLTPPGSIGKTMVTLGNLYDLVNTGTSTPSTDFSTPDEVEPTFHSLQDIFNLLASKIADIDPSTVLEGTTIFGVEGTLSQTDVDIVSGEMSITVDPDQNENTEVTVSDEEPTNDVDIYTAQLNSTDGNNTINTVTVALSTSTGTLEGLEDMVESVKLIIDGTEVGSTTSFSGGSDSLVFESVGHLINESDIQNLVVRVDVKAQNDSGYPNGVGIQVTGVSIDFTDELDEDKTVSNSDDGGVISFSVDSIIVELHSIPSAVSPVSNDEAKGRFYVQISVTAPSESDVYIPKWATTTIGIVDVGARFIVVDGNGDTVSATTSVSSNILTRISGGSETGGRYKISAGNTAILKLDVIVDNTGAEFARTLGIQLMGINYKEGLNDVADTQYNSNFDENFRSDTVFLTTSNIAD